MKAGYIAAEHLIKRGRKNIAIITGRRNLKGGYNALQRYNGLKTALEDNGMNFDEKNLVEVWRYSFEDGVEAFNELFKNDSGIDVVFCAAGDVCAMGFMKAAHDAGASIPGDIAVVGFDNLNFSAFSTPTLTTIKQLLEEMGTIAFKFVIDKEFYESKKGEHISYDAKIVIRKSTLFIALLQQMFRRHS